MWVGCDMSGIHALLASPNAKQLSYAWFLSRVGDSIEEVILEGPVVVGCIFRGICNGDTVCQRALVQAVYPIFNNPTGECYRVPRMT